MSQEAHKATNGHANGTDAYPNGHARHKSEEVKDGDAQDTTIPVQTVRTSSLDLDDLDDAFSLGDDDGLEKLDIAPSISFREMAEQEQAEAALEDEVEEEHLPTPSRTAFREVVGDSPGDQTPTGSFAFDGISEVDGRSPDGKQVITLDMNGGTPHTPDITSPEMLATMETPVHEDPPVNRVISQTPELATEFVDISLEPGPGEPRREVSATTTPTTATTVVTSTTASFLSTPASTTSSSAPGSARSSHEVGSAESPRLQNGVPSHDEPQHIAPPPPRHTRHRGPSVLETVISQTRPVYLPPKPKSEDRRHLKDWQTMMAHARAAEQKRKHEAELLAVEKEHHMAQMLEIWEREIMPDITAAAKDKKLRKLWWTGVPPKLRGRVWAATVGNPLALSKDSWRPYISRARRAVTAGKFPRQTLELIEDDIAETMPSLRIFDAVHGPLHQDLRDMLCAWTVARSEEGLSYVRGASHVAGMFLINMPVEQAFFCFRNLLDRHCLRSFYTGQNDDMEGYYRIFDTLLADVMPKVYYNFQRHHIPPTRYLPDWIMPVFVPHLPFDTCARIWDLVLLEGDSFLFRAALAVLGVMEGRLYFPDHDELMQVLRGEDGTRGKGKGKELVDDAGRYAQYGMTEEAVFDRIAAVHEEWKDNTWMRLVQRELPDL